MSIQNLITKKLTETFTPLHLEVVNDSAKHHGHAGDNGSGESHFSITIISDKFAGKSRVECHRMINNTLKDELSGKVHALAINAKAPQSNK